MIELAVHSARDEAVRGRVTPAVGDGRRVGLPRSVGRDLENQERLVDAAAPVTAGGGADVVKVDRRGDRP